MTITLSMLTVEHQFDLINTKCISQQTAFLEAHSLLEHLSDATKEDTVGTYQKHTDIQQNDL